mgnify:CR=1 FL=1
MPGGRPSKYKGEETLIKARDYVRDGYLELGEVVPTQEGLAYTLKIARQTLHDWKNDEDKQGFSDILEECNQKQTLMLMSGSLKNDLNANIAKLMLGKQGYSEKSSQEITGPGGGAIGPIILQPVETRKSDDETD